MVLRSIRAPSCSYAAPAHKTSVSPLSPQNGGAFISSRPIVHEHAFTSIPTTAAVSAKLREGLTMEQSSATRHFNHTITQIAHALMYMHSSKHVRGLGDVGSRKSVAYSSHTWSVFKRRHSPSSSPLLEEKEARTFPRVPSQTEASAGFTSPVGFSSPPSTAFASVPTTAFTPSSLAFFSPLSISFWGIHGALRLNVPSSMVAGVV